MGMNRHFVWLALALGTTAQAHAPADTAAIAAAIADPSRPATERALDEARHPDVVLALAQVRRGEVVADWGAGTAYWADLLADAVGPRGLVYAVGIAANQDPADWRPAMARHANLRTLFARGEALTLAPNSLDAIIANLEYHDLYWVSAKYQYPPRDVPAVLRNWFAALRPGGRVVVIDHVGPPGDPRDTADKLHRIDPERVRADFVAAGFVLDGTSDAFRHADDPHTQSVFDPAIKGKTDRIAWRFVRP